MKSQRIYFYLIIFFISSCFSPKTQNSSKSILSIKPVNVHWVIGIAQVAPEFEIIPLSSQVGGIVNKIYKRENDSVKVGEIILELDHKLEDAKIKQMEAEVITQGKQIQVDLSSLEEYKAKYHNAQKDLERLENLFSKGSETQQNVDDARTNLLSYESNLNRLENTVQVSKSKLQESLEAVQVSKQEKDQKIIRSPVPGKILQIDPVLGSTVDNKTSFGQISPKGRIIALGEIDESNASKIQEGQRAWIRNLGSLDTISMGTVYFAASYLKKKSLFTDQPGEKEDRRVREIKIVLDRPDKLLLNSRVECVVNLGSKP